MAINLTSYQAALQAKLDAVTTDEKEMLLLGKAVEATIGNIAITDIQTEGTTQVNAVNTAGSTKTGEVNTAGSTQVTAVNAAGSTKTGEVNSAGGTQVTAVNAAGTSQVATINAIDTYTKAEADAKIVELAPIPDIGDLVITLDSGMVATNNGQTITKTESNNGWSRQFISKKGFTGSAYVKFTADTNDAYLMVGLTSDPTANASYSTIDFAMYPYENNGSLHTYENGTGTNLGVAYTSSTVLEVIYSGTTVKYYADGVLLRTKNTAAGQTLYVDSSFYYGASGGRESKINNLEFGSVPNVGGGKVLQVVQFQTNNKAYYTGDATLISGNITPTKSTSKILVRIVIMMGRSNINGSIGIRRGSTYIGTQVATTYAGAVQGNNTAEDSHGVSQDYGISSNVYEYLDSPSTTGSTNYNLQYYLGAGSGHVTVNRQFTDNGGSAVSSITLTEIGA